MQNIPALQGIDHIHLYVPDRQQAASWYQQTLGFIETKALSIWAEDAQGPLTLEDASGQIHLALFQRKTPKPSTAIAFGTNGENFLRWKTYLDTQGILLRCADHQIAWSLYFQDPYDNVHEITTYQHSFVKKHL